MTDELRRVPAPTAPTIRFPWVVTCSHFILLLPTTAATAASLGISRQGLLRAAPAILFALAVQIAMMAFSAEHAAQAAAFARSNVCPDRSGSLAMVQPLRRHRHSCVATKESSSSVQVSRMRACSNPQFNPPCLRGHLARKGCDHRTPIHTSSDDISISESTLIPNCVSQSEHPSESAASRPGTTAAPEAQPSISPLLAGWMKHCRTGPPTTAVP